MPRDRAIRKGQQPACQNGMRNHGTAPNLLKSLERVKGIEPSSSAWKAVALPLSYTRAVRTLAGHVANVSHPCAAWQDHPGSYP